MIFNCGFYESVCAWPCSRGGIHVVVVASRRSSSSNTYGMVGRWVGREGGPANAPAELEEVGAVEERAGRRCARSTARQRGSAPRERSARDVPLRSVLSRPRAVLVLKRSRSGRPTSDVRRAMRAPSGARPQAIPLRTSHPLVQDLENGSALSRDDPINDLDDRDWLALKKQGTESSKSTHPGPRSASCSTPTAIPTDPPGPMVDLQPHSGLRGRRTRRRRTLAKNNV